METATENTVIAIPGAIYRTYSMDYTTQIEHAMRSDGVWFKRYQQRDPRFGYRWTAWRQGEAPATLGRGYMDTRKARLPK